MKKELSIDEMERLIKEYAFLKQWTAVKNLACKYYSPNATKVEIWTGSEYNDEGGSYSTIESLTVYDAEGNNLDLDPLLPEWAEFRKRHMWIDIEDFDTDEWNYEIRGDEGVEAPDHNETYDLTKAPKITYPVVYVEIETETETGTEEEGS